MTFNRLPPGTTVSGHPIQAQITNRVQPKRFCYLIAGTHGDEPEGVYVLDQLISWLKVSPSEIPMVIIPVLNPDGFAAGSRVNANGVDLNRNLPTPNWTEQSRNDQYSPGPAPGSEPENRYLLSLFQQYPPGFVLTFHSWKPMLNSNGDCNDILTFLHRKNDYPVVKDEIEGHPTPGSLGSYASEILKTPVLTFECPTLEQQPDMDAIWQENRQALTGLMTSRLIEKKLGL
ncbi:MAG: DUF2817 domain-containing protein [Endozoicomonas sp.]